MRIYFNNLMYTCAFFTIMYTYSLLDRNIVVLYIYTCIYNILVVITLVF